MNDAITLIKTIGNYSVYAVGNEWIVRDDRAGTWFDAKRWKNYTNAVKVATACNAEIK